MSSSAHVVHTTPKQAISRRWNARAKRAKLLFFIVKYANLWHSCRCSRRGLLKQFISRRGNDEIVKYRNDSIYRPPFDKRPLSNASPPLNARTPSNVFLLISTPILLVILQRRQTEVHLPSIAHKRTVIPRYKNSGLRQSFSIIMSMWVYNSSKLNGYIYRFFWEIADSSLKDRIRHQ